MEKKEKNNSINKITLNKEDILIENKIYELNLNNETYYLILKIISNDKILFIAKNKSNELLIYQKEYTYDELIKNLLLQKNYYYNIDKIYNFYIISLSKNKISLLYNKYKNILKLVLKKQIDYEEFNCYLELILVQESKDKINESIYKILYEEIKKENEEIKNNLELIKK